MSKSDSFDELEGGAIGPNTWAYESAAAVQTPGHVDYTTVMRGAEISQFEGSPSPFYNDALNMIPKNITPMFVYDQAAQGQNPVFVKDALLKGLSGFGAHKDSSQIQKAVVHSLKHYPKLLHMYLNSKKIQSTEVGKAFTLEPPAQLKRRSPSKKERVKQDAKMESREARLRLQEDRLKSAKLRALMA